MKFRDLTYCIKGCILKVYNEMGPGLLEGAYEAALMHELIENGLDARRQVALPVIYKGVEIKDAYKADIIVENSVILELKSVESLSRANGKQIINYLKLSGLTFGYLVNFNTTKIMENIIPFVNGYEDDAPVINKSKNNK